MLIQILSAYTLHENEVIFFLSVLQINQSTFYLFICNQSFMIFYPWSSKIRKLNINFDTCVVIKTIFLIN